MYLREVLYLSILSWPEGTLLTRQPWDLVPVVADGIKLVSLSVREYTLDVVENLLRAKTPTAYTLASVSSSVVWKVRSGLVGRCSSIVVAQHKFFFAEKQRNPNGDS